MKCPECKSKDLLALVTLKRVLPLAVRVGPIKVGGTRISQMDLKFAWEKTAAGDVRLIRGPIMCADCDEELFIVMGAPSNPYRGAHTRAVEVGAQHFIDGGTLPA